MLKVKDANLEINELYSLFSQHDQVRMNVRSGVAYIMFQDPSKADLAQRALNGKIFNQKPLKVQHCQWTGQYPDENQQDSPAMDIQSENVAPPKNIQFQTEYQFHPIIQNLRNQFAESFSKESNELDKNIKIAETKINNLNVNQQLKISKLKSLKTIVQKERDKMKSYFSQMQNHLSSKFVNLYKSQEIDLESGVHHSSSNNFSSTQIGRMKVNLKFNIKSPVRRLCKVSNQQFIASFQPINFDSQKLNTVSLFNINDEKAKNTFNFFQKSTVALSNYVSGEMHWAFVGEESGKLSTVQLNPLDLSATESYKPHSNPIIDIKPLISNPLQSIEYYVSSSKNTIRKWKVEIQERFTSVFGLQFTDDKLKFQPQTYINSMDVLSRTNIVYSIKDNKIKIFNIEKDGISFTLPVENAATKVLKVENNVFAATCKDILNLIDIRTQKSITHLKFQNRQLSTVALVDDNKIAFGGREIIGVSDFRKNAEIWKEVVSHGSSVVRDMIVINNMIVSADANQRMLLWKS